MIDLKRLEQDKPVNTQQLHWLCMKALLDTQLLILGQTLLGKTYNPVYVERHIDVLVNLRERVEDCLKNKGEGSHGPE